MLALWPAAAFRSGSQTWRSRPRASWVCSVLRLLASYFWTTSPRTPSSTLMVRCPLALVTVLRVGTPAPVGA